MISDFTFSSNFLNLLLSRNFDIQLEGDDAKKNKAGRKNDRDG